MIIINGAGIAGLTLANSLERANIEYVLIEQAAQISAIGAGIILQNNGLAILKHLELLSELQGQTIKQMQLGYKNSRLSSYPAQQGLNTLCVERGELQRVLMLNIPNEKIHLDTHILNYQLIGETVQISLSNSKVLSADYLINAAGIHSNLHGEPELVDTKQVCWRAIVDLKRPIECSGEYWFGSQRFGIAPVAKDKAYLFHVADLTSELDLNRYSSQQRQQWIVDKSEHIDSVKQLDFQTTKWLFHPLKQRTINWGNHKVIAIGDAAHAMTPNLGQGAVIAMEDAIELGQLIKRNDKNIAKNLKKLRHHRVVRVQKQSLSVGKIAHHDSPIVNFFKSVALSIAPMNLALKFQVKWMNQFINRMEGF